MESKEFKRLYKKGTRNFAGEKIKNLQLEGKTLEELKMEYSNLYKANLYKATILDSNLKGINLSRANLSFSYIKDVDLSNSKLYNTDFRDAYLENVILDESNLKESNFTGAQVYEVGFNKANLEGVIGLVEQKSKSKPKTNEGDFRCGYCKMIISDSAYGTSHRNHCPDCGYSKHVDEKPGDRKSDCQSLMEPVGLMLKENEELSLIHHCLGCDRINYNRKAGDDNALMLWDIYKNSENLDSRISKLIEEEKVRMLGLREGERVLCIAAFFADWAKALKEGGLIVDYNEVSREILDYVKARMNFNEFILSDYVYVPRKKDYYDWTFSFEPVGAKAGLPIAILRSLLNKKGCKLVIFPRLKGGKPVGKKTENFPKILHTFTKVYGVETKIEDVFIASHKIGGKNIESSHRVFTIFTDENAKKLAEKDLEVLFNNEKGNREVLQRLQALGSLLKEEYRKMLNH